MTTDNPYTGLPPRSFWRSGVAEASLSPADIYERKFEIAATDKIATAGSCFAQHIGRRLTASGYNVYDSEPAPAWLSADQRAAYSYGVYSARYGNIYTVAQLARLAAECVGEFTPANIAWRKGDRFIDALRPGVDPDGFATEEELLLDRRYHLERVRRMFQIMDVFVFTLGLTETWIHKPSGTVYPIAPGVMAGDYDAEACSFLNLNFSDTAKSLQMFLKTLSKIRGGRMPRVILTVSPVPLTATAAGGHVLPATVYSKSILRAVAGEAASTYDFVDYFPSYEIITNPAARSAFFDENLRTVKAQGVQAVMDVFFRAHPPLPGAHKAADQDQADTAVQCEEAILAAFGQ